MNIVEIYKKLPTERDCIQYLEKIKWNGEPKCPYCNSKRCTALTNEQRHHCNRCNTSFSVTVGTIFHASKLDLQKWFLAICLILNAKKWISARQLGRDIGVTKDTARSMGMRIRKAMLEERELFSWIAEMDETYIWGKPRHKWGKRGRGTDKEVVVWIVERWGKVTAKRVNNVNWKTIASMIKEKVDVKNCTLMTDEFRWYSRVSDFINHETVNHSIKQYVDWNKHTNTIEWFWSLLKRWITGQYHKVSIRYLQKYIDEFCYKYNHRKTENLFEVFLFATVK